MKIDKLLSGGSLQKHVSSISFISEGKDIIGDEIGTLVVYFDDGKSYAFADTLKEEYEQFNNASDLTQFYNENVRLN